MDRSISEEMKDFESKLTFHIYIKNLGDKKKQQKKKKKWRSERTETPENYKSVSTELKVALFSNSGQLKCIDLLKSHYNVPFLVTVACLEIWEF